MDVFERAVEALLFADSGEVLDVRIPIACIGIELLAWAILPRWAGIDETEADELKAGPAARRLLEWAGIQTEIPDELPALAARRDALSQHGWVDPKSSSTCATAWSTRRRAATIQSGRPTM